MRPSTAFSSLLLLFLASVRAQDSDPSSYGSQFVTALQSAGFTGLADTISKINGTAVAQELFSRLSSGRNFTVFAPDNNAIQQLSSEVSQNTTLLAEYISYHFVYGDLTNSSSTDSSGGGGAGGGGAGSSSTMSSSTACSSSSSEGGGGGSSSSTTTVTIGTGGGSGSSSTTTITVGGGGGGTNTETSTATPSATAALFGRHFSLLSYPRQDDGGGDQGGNGSQDGGDDSDGSGDGSLSRRDGGGSSGPQPFAGIWPNVTIGRTLLSASDLVMLEGNKSQALAWTRYSPDCSVTILNQAQNITVENSTTWRNLFINVINGTLTPPSNLTTALVAINATVLESVLGSVQVPSDDGTNETVVTALQNATGITVFVPANDAFTSDVNSTLQGLQGNTTALRAIIQNHYINGTTLYSPQVRNTTTAITAAGVPVQFVKNETGTFVTIANISSVQIIHPDILLDNGVAHVVNQVFLVGQSDLSQAGSAFSSATSFAAAQTTTETGTIGPLSILTQSSSESSSSESQTSTSEQPSST